MLGIRFRLDIIEPVIFMKETTTIIPVYNNMYESVHKTGIYIYSLVYVIYIPVSLYVPLHVW